MSYCISIFVHSLAENRHDNWVPGKWGICWQRSCLAASPFCTCSSTCAWMCRPRHPQSAPKSSMERRDPRLDPAVSKCGGRIRPTKNPTGTVLGGICGDRFWEMDGTWRNSTEHKWMLGRSPAWLEPHHDNTYSLTISHPYTQRHAHTHLYPSPTGEEVAYCVSMCMCMCMYMYINMYMYMYMYIDVHVHYTYMYM